MSRLVIDNDYSMKYISIGFLDNNGFMKLINRSYIGTHQCLKTERHKLWNSYPGSSHKTYSELSTKLIKLKRSESGLSEEIGIHVISEYPL